jgi:hypothetical protein
MAVATPLSEVRAARSNKHHVGSAATRRAASGIFSEIKGPSAGWGQLNLEKNTLAHGADQREGPNSFSFVTKLRRSGANSLEFPMDAGGPPDQTNCTRPNKTVCTTKQTSGDA